MSSALQKLFAQDDLKKQCHMMGAGGGIPGNKNGRTRDSEADQKERKTCVPVAKALLPLKQLLYPGTAAIHLLYLWQIV